VGQFGHSGQGEILTNAITFQAAVNRVQTMADGGIRIVLDLPETEIAAMAQLAACQVDKLYLNVKCTLSEENERN
jgi:hypothetical protein